MLQFILYLIHPWWLCHWHWLYGMCIFPCIPVHLTHLSRQWWVVLAWMGLIALCIRQLPELNRTLGNPCQGSSLLVSSVSIFVCGTALLHEFQCVCAWLGDLPAEVDQPTHCAASASVYWCPSKSLVNVKCSFFLWDWSLYSFRWGKATDRRLVRLLSGLCLIGLCLLVLRVRKNLRKK